MKSAKSAYSSKRPAKRFKKVRRRFIEVREAVQDDLKYAWAAYRKGALEVLNPIFGSDMGLEDFREAFPEILASSGNSVWTIVGPVPGRGVMPIGMVFGLIRERVIHDVHAVWFPWATPRTTFEAAKEFFERTRRDFFVKVFASEETEKFFDAIVSTGALKRGCRFYGLYPGKAAIFYYAKV